MSQSKSVSKKSVMERWKAARLEASGSVRDGGRVQTRKRRLPPVTSSGSRLKAERVEERLKRMPDWKVASGGRAITRVRELPSPTAAVAYVTYVASLADAQRQAVTLNLDSVQVSVTLSGPAKRGAGLTHRILDFAAELA